jgi:peptide/nickel transport system permease protein
VVIFLLLRLVPGDAVNAMLGDEGSLSPEVQSTLRRLFGLDQPLYAQYLTWLTAVLRGDLGTSLRSGQPVSEILVSRLPVTVELAVLAVAISALVGIPLGMLAALNRGSVAEFPPRLLGLLGLSIPNFWLATLLILFTSSMLGWLPSLIYVSPITDLPTNLGQMLLPTIALATHAMATTVRMTRSSMLEVLTQPYITTARAKGLRSRIVVSRHGLRNALIPVITAIGIQIGYLLGGTVVIEQIFGLPGVGWTLLHALTERDYPVVQGAVLMLTIVFVAVNLLVDLSYSALDPRIRAA